jgi:ubiquinone/menaquinone biosynthesis C-methylase UbiE
MSDATVSVPSGLPDFLRYPTHAVEQNRLGRRTASTSAAFLLPQLKPGMRLLDGGCGVGSITLGLAGVVAPGEVIGLDREVEQIVSARALATEIGAANVRFEVGDIYALPFPDASFDAVFAHTLLMHLSEPLRALREFRRVLRPGGVIGVADDDQGTLLIAPPTPPLEALYALHQRWLMEVRGAHPFAARDHRGTLVEAGFSRVLAGASTGGFGVYGTLERTREIAAWWAAFARRLAEEGEVTGRGWVDDAQLATMAEAALDWGERPDAFMAVMSVTAVGWVDDVARDA